MKMNKTYVRRFCAVVEEENYFLQKYTKIIYARKFFEEFKLSDACIWLSMLLSENIADLWIYLLLYSISSGVDACNNGDIISFGIRYALNETRL